MELGIIKLKQETNYQQAHKNMLKQVSSACPSLSLLCYLVFTLFQKYLRTHRPLTIPKVPGTLLLFALFLN